MIDENYETKSVQNGDERPLGFCKFSPNSKLLGVASWSGELRLWSVSDSSLVKSFKGHQDRLSAFDFHPQASLGQSESSVNLATAGNIIIFTRNGWRMSPLGNEFKRVYFKTYRSHCAGR